MNKKQSTNQSFSHSINQSFSHSINQSFSHSQLTLLKKFLRLSAERELYTIGQAAFRLNISRNEFVSEFIESGKLNVLFRNGRQFVTGESIKQFIKEHSFIHSSIQTRKTA